VERDLQCSPGSQRCLSPAELLYLSSCRSAQGCNVEWDLQCNQGSQCCLSPAELLSPNAAAQCKATSPSNSGSGGGGSGVQSCQFVNDCRSKADACNLYATQHDCKGQAGAALQCLWQVNQTPGASVAETNRCAVGQDWGHLLAVATCCSGTHTVSVCLASEGAVLAAWSSTPWCKCPMLPTPATCRSVGWILLFLLRKEPKKEAPPLQRAVLFPLRGSRLKFGGTRPDVCALVSDH
jgi:hypothetical protein